MPIKVKWTKSDISSFDPDDTDEAKISRQLWVPCRLCRQMFLRIRLTGRYCGTCKRGFCEGEHGSFVGRGIGVCVRCSEFQIRTLPKSASSVPADRVTAAPDSFSRRSSGPVARLTSRGRFPARGDSRLQQAL